MNLYETSKLVDEYLLFHYGSAEEIDGPDASSLDFAVRTAAHADSRNKDRALDLGCAVGRSSFELSRVYNEVIGIDFSHAFIAAAEKLRQGESLDYQRLDEAHQSTQLIAKAPSSSRSEKVSFRQGDAMNLPVDLGRFDLVHAANLICRLPEPLKLLEKLPELVRPGGQLVLATPCTWLAEFTPPENFPRTDTLSWLKSTLSPAFELVEQTDEPFLIRETARKFQWTRSLVTKWQRVG